MDRHRKIGLTAFLFVFVLAACLVSLQPGDGPEELITTNLPDGRLIRLESVSFGRSHILRTGPDWLRSLQRKLPRPLRGLLGPEVTVIRSTTTEDTLIPFLSIDRKPGVTARPTWSSFRVMADSGEVMDISSWSSGRSIHGRFLSYPRLPNFPRRDSSFTLTGMVDRLPWSIRIPNPIANRSYPNWTPGPRHQTNRVDDYDFVLGRTQFTSHGKGASFGTSLDVYRGGRSVKNWFKTSYRLHDATGNSGYRLSTNEPAWKIDFEVRRHHSAPWRPDEYHDFTLDELPGETDYRTFSVGRPINGVPIGRLWIGGRGRFTMSDGAVTAAQPLGTNRATGMSSSSSGSHWQIKWSRTAPWIFSEMPSPPKGVSLSIFVTDATGANIPTDHGGGTSVGYFRTQHYDLKPPKKSTPPYIIRLAVQTNLHTEFVIAPSQLPRIDRNNPRRSHAN